MSDTYTVQRGDNLTKIARRNGYPSWRVIYNHPDNAAFRRKRRNPDLILPGDVIVLPDQPPTTLPSATLKLPWNFARRFRLSPRLYLQPVQPPNYGPFLPNQLPPGLRPPFRRTPPSGSHPIVLGGPVWDNLPPLGGPVRGGYGTALKWTGKAILRYPYVDRKLDALKDWGWDFVWRSRSSLGKGISIGLGVTGAAVLLSIEPTRDFIRSQAHGFDFGLGVLGADWLSVRPLLGIDGNWGGMINFNLMRLGD